MRPKQSSALRTDRIRAGRSRPSPSALLLAALLWGAALPAPALAHLQLSAATPAEGAELAVAPESLRLSFSQPVELAFSDLVLVGPSGEVALGEPMLAPGTDTVLVGEIRGPLVAGEYAVRWQTAGPDGHPIRGEYRFRILPGAEGLAPPAPPPTAPAAATRTAPPAEHGHLAEGGGEGFDAESPPYAAVRWLTFVGLLGVIGVAAFRLLVLGVVARREGAPGEELVERAARGAAHFGIGATMVLLVALALRLYAQSVALHGADGVWDGERLRAVLAGTTWGWGWILQAAATLAALLGFALARGGRSSGWAVSALAVTALAFTPALSGHAAGMGELSALAVLADGLHVLGAGGWLGSLLLVVVVGVPVALGLGPERRGAAVASLVRAFSPTALAFAALVVATGLLAAWLHLGSFPALWSSPYGRVLLLKLAVLTGVFGAGAYNWLRVKPSLGTEAAAGRLRRSAAFELATALIVLAVTAVLVATPPPAEEQQTAGAPPSRGDATTGPLP